VGTPPVTFDPAQWTTQFPEFLPIQGLGQTYFNLATATFAANDVTNPAFNDGNLPTLLNLATSHVAWLLCPKDGNGNPTNAVGASSAPNIVGRISNATQGSVSVQTEWGGGDPTALEKYLIQTKYGAAYWAGTSQYRTAQYAARPTIVIGGRFRNSWVRSGPAGLWGWWG
jgi:hypothetical protein